MTASAGFPYTRGMTDPSLPSAAPDHWQNLLWSLACPDISTDSRLPWLPASRRAALHDFFSRREIRTGLEAKLIRLLEQGRSRRLGIYFENLWAFAFQHHPNYRLLARNLPIRSEGRTLGELDFVVQHLPDDATEHWELAVKFYLQIQSQWVGPGLRDRLDIKLARMADHQLPIAHTTEAITTLNQHGIRLDRKWALMPGRLFTPLHTSPPGEPGYWWADTAQFLRYFSEPPTGWLLLPKQSWLAPCAVSPTVHPQALSAINPTALRHQLESRGPLCIAAIGDNGEAYRGFLVPDDWQQRAVQSLPAE